ncbi:MAG: CehA/McbA family metallohydrolase [Paracoccaceae bacterium]
MTKKTARKLGPANKPRPDITTVVQLSAADKARCPYYQVPFEVPQGTTRIEVRCRYASSEVCVIDLGAGDPVLTDFPSQGGLRGWSGGARSGFFIARDGATPGYVAGDIAAGTWQVILGLYRVPQEPVSVRLDIWFSAEPRALVQPMPVVDAVRRGAGWYCGDLQCHTFHSDAHGAPQHLHETARREGLDFLAVTDHNTTTQQQAYFDAASSADMVFVPAYEFTTEFGHANVFGARQVFDFRVNGDADVVEMVRRIRASGALFSINHDKPNIPWQYTVPEIDCMEVWQTHWLAGNHTSLMRYQQRLAEGRRITALGSSDFHQPALEPEGNLFTLGRPSTFLWLEQLSVTAVLEALRRGRSFVSESPKGPMLTIRAGTARHGDTCSPGRVELSLSATRAQGDMLHIWDATGMICKLPIDAADWHATVALDQPHGFVRAEIVAVKSRQKILDDLLEFLGDRRPGHSLWDDSVNHPIRRALTSPIYIAAS